MSDENAGIGRRQFLVRSAAAAGSLTFAGTVLAACGKSSSSSSSSSGGGGSGPLKVGALIPFTGIETHNGKAMQYGVEMAVAEVNAANGIAGRKINLTLADTAAQVDQAVQKAQEFITQKHVDLLVGTLPSNVRAAVFDVAKKSNTLFMNPTFYEGQLCSKYYFSTGATPNQTIDPLAAYTVKNLGKKIYLIASDYVWGTGSVKAAEAAIEKAGGTVVGKPTFVPLGATDFSAEIRKIQAAKPEIVWPFVAGQDGITFLKQLTDAGVRSDVEVVADYIDELIVPALSRATYKGIVNCATYFMSLDTAANKKFLDDLHAKYGPNAKISSFGVEMYNNIKLLEVAAGSMDSWDKDKVVDALTTAEFNGPGGHIAFQADNHHAIQDVHIAQVESDGTFKVVMTEKDVAPDAGCTV